MEFRRFDRKRAQIASTALSRPEEKHGAIETTIEDGSKRIPGHLVDRRPLRPLRAGRPLEGGNAIIRLFGRRLHITHDVLYRPSKCCLPGACDRESFFEIESA